MVLFSADDGSSGAELWESDGTAGGTLLAKDINPGPMGSSPFGLTNTSGKVYFQADDGAHGIELWVIGS
jgi:ELWxxDGT repeat protein